MAANRDDLIARYLAGVDRALAGRIRHADRVTLEIEDHLRTSADELRASGVGEHDAARRAIECFGPVEEVASTFLTLEHGGGGTRPTRFTVWAGLLGAIGGLLIALAAAVQVATDDQTHSPDRGVGAVIGTVVLLGAVLMVGVGFAGIVARHRGTLRRIDRLALGVLLAGLVIMWLPYWGVLVFALPLMLAGTIAIGVRVYRVHALPRPPLAFMLVAGLGLIVLTVTKQHKSSIVFAAGWVFVIAGWCWLQYTLWSERPANDAVPA